MPSSTARIAKNTLALYARQILTILVSLFTVRVMLENLGIENYGIYNVVAGIVALFTFLNGAMTQSTQRFLNFALGQNDTKLARNVYSVSFIIFFMIALLVVILSQTVGLWFFYTWLNIPSERQAAALISYQFIIATAVISILQIPYRATIIAHEKMSFFAVLSIIEALLRLGIVFLLPIILFDKLVVYAFLVCITGIIILLIHKAYCNRVFATARFQYSASKELLRQLLGFSGWNVFARLANVISIQGTNLLVNIFYGVALNAAMGIASQVNTAIYQFVSGFQTAFNPQIVKLYSAKEYDYFIQLVFRTSKLSFYLLLFFVLPLYINAEFVLQIWLNNVPDYVIIFTQLILISSLIGAIDGPLWMSIHATGKIKKHELIGSCFIIVHLPLALVFLWTGFSPVWILITRTSLGALMLVWRIFFLEGKIEFPVKSFYCRVILPAIAVAGISAFIAIFMQNLFTDAWNRFIVSCVISTLSIGCFMYLIGLTRQEKTSLRDWIKRKVRY